MMPNLEALMNPATDLRQTPRIPISYEVKLVVEERMIAYTSALNLSLGGILLRHRAGLPVGTPCGVAILLGAGDPGRRVVARGTVVRSDQQGVAVAFSKALDPNSLNALRTLIASLEPVAPPEGASALGSDRSASGPVEPKPQSPEEFLTSLLERLKPGSTAGEEAMEPWAPPPFRRYEEIRTWLKESVLTAKMYERYPDGRWTMELLLKEQIPGKVRTIVL